MVVKKTNGVQTSVKKSQLIENFDVRISIKHPEVIPWNVQSKSCKEVTCMGVFEFIPGTLRGRFMEEIFRIMTDDGKAVFLLPYWSTAMAYHDYRYQFPPLTEQSFLMFNKKWREVNKPELDLKCDFDFNYGFKWDAETEMRNEQTQAYSLRRNLNVTDFMQLTLTKRNPDEKK